jgi:F0F1-type ATP synthase membrane subunit c/vacuolar-type H+-ATPase subunit K
VKLAILPLNGRTRRGAYLVAGLALGAALVGPAVAIADTTAVTYYACAIRAPSVLW